MSSIQKLLVANRGEIAIRVMRTCRAMGISTVAVYSDADLRAPHVRFAGEAVRIGPSAAIESYLNIANVIEAARRSGADAIHPGYGFLSENADFAAACRRAGLVFIGPSEDTIRMMGLKTTARQLVSRAGTPTAPGYDGDDQSASTLRLKALEIGLPVLIKASAGGGGKGMRVVRNADALEPAIEGSRREAEKAFGDGALLLEKYIEKARHIEVQILGDSYGGLIHLFERECSIQRRHQKIIEESPSPALTPELRERIFEAAVAAGRAIGYVNGGTVEFILAPTGEFYFIEVNTRLQVEHPVTEMITGLDLVQLQIEIAEGKPLPFAQRDVSRTGHAIEARLYAEDPANDFLPATGTIHGWTPPPSIAGLRIDRGVEQGTEVGVHYDPMLAKVIAYGPDRIGALRKLAYGIRQTTVHGVQTNQRFLLRLLEHPDFQAGDFHTEFVAEQLHELLDRDGQADAKIAAVVATLYLHKTREAQARILPHVELDYRNNPYRDPSVKVMVGTETIEVGWRRLDGGRYAMSIEDWQVIAQPVEFEPGSIRLTLDGAQRLFSVTEAGGQLIVQMQSGPVAVRRLPRYPESNAAAGQADTSAPMPGLVSKILVTLGQEVHAGDPLVILEAMKMEQTLVAATDGVVEAIMVKQGDVVAPGDVLVHVNPQMTQKNADEKT